MRYTIPPRLPLQPDPAATDPADPGSRVEESSFSPFHHYRGHSEVRNAALSILVWTSPSQAKRPPRPPLISWSISWGGRPRIPCGDPALRAPQAASSAQALKMKWPQQLLPARPLSLLHRSQACWVFFAEVLSISFLRSSIRRLVWLSKAPSRASPSFPRS